MRSPSGHWPVLSGVTSRKASLSCWILFFLVFLKQLNSLSQSISLVCVMGSLCCCLSLVIWFSCPCMSLVGVVCFRSLSAMKWSSICHCLSSPGDISAIGHLLLDFWLIVFSDYELWNTRLMAYRKGESNACRVIHRKKGNQILAIDFGDTLLNIHFYTLILSKSSRVISLSLHVSTYKIAKHKANFKVLQNSIVGKNFVTFLVHPMPNPYFHPW